MSTVNFGKAPQVKVVTVLPSLKDAYIGDVYLLIDGGADNNKLHVRVAAGWIKSAALS